MVQRQALTLKLLKSSDEKASSLGKNSVKGRTSWSRPYSSSQVDSTTLSLQRGCRHSARLLERMSPCVYFCADKKAPVSCGGLSARLPLIDGCAELTVPRLLLLGKRLLQGLSRDGCAQAARQGLSCGPRC